MSVIIRRPLEIVRSFRIKKLPIIDCHISGGCVTSRLATSGSFRRRHFNGQLTPVGERDVGYTVLTRDWKMVNLVESFDVTGHEITEEDLHQILLLDSDNHPGYVLARGGTCNIFGMYGFLNTLYIVCFRHENVGLGRWCVDSIGIDDDVILPNGSRLFIRVSGC